MPLPGRDPRVCRTAGPRPPAPCARDGAARRRRRPGIVASGGLLLGLAASVLGLGTAAPAAAQQPDTFTNLKVLPKDISRERLLAVMRHFTDDLGVRCTFCHVQEKGQRRPDFAKDDKLTKRRARFMLEMVRDLNGKVLPQIPEPESSLVRVNCYTCHRGRPMPQTLADTLGRIIAAEGVGAVPAVYQELREKYYGRGMYDFGPSTLVEMALGLAREKRTDDALALLQLNLTQYPRDADTYVGIGEVQQAAGRKDEAIQAYQKALELDPKNRAAQRALERLGST